MKAKILFVGILLFLSLEIEAQDFKKLRVGFGISYLADRPEVNGALSWEVGYRIKDQTLIGYRAESAFVTHNTIASKIIFYQHYFKSPKKVRPFAGLGVGVYAPTGKGMSGGCAPGPGFSELHFTDIQTKFGFSPRLGFDYRHFTMLVEWNMAEASRATVSNNLLPTETDYVVPYTDYIRNNYLSVRIGFFLGGGRKRN